MCLMALACSARSITTPTNSLLLCKAVLPHPFPDLFFFDIGDVKGAALMDAKDAKVFEFLEPVAHFLSLTESPMEFPYWLTNFCTMVK